MSLFQQTRLYPLKSPEKKKRMVNFSNRIAKSYPTPKHNPMQMKRKTISKKTLGNDIEMIKSFFYNIVQTLNWSIRLGSLFQIMHDY